MICEKIKKMEVTFMSRLGIHEYYMNICVAASLRSTCMRRKVGAVIVK